MTIKIDLNNLTQAHIDEAAPHIRKRTYSSPCIIGALMTPEERKIADMPTSYVGAALDSASEGISALFYKGRVELADPDQLTEVQEIQSAFDFGWIGQLTELLEARGLKWTGMSEEEASELKVDLI